MRASASWRSVRRWILIWAGLRSDWSASKSDDGAIVGFEDASTLRRFDTCRLAASILRYFVASWLCGFAASSLVDSSLRHSSLDTRLKATGQQYELVTYTVRMKPPERPVVSGADSESDESDVDARMRGLRIRGFVDSWIRGFADSRIRGCRMKLQRRSATWYR